MANQKMGSKKRTIEFIEEPTNRMITYAKRRGGLLKKAYELSVLCETDMALLITSPSGKLTCFPAAGQTRIEDVLEKFIDLPTGERGSPLEEKEQLYRLLEKAKAEDSCHPIECGLYNSQFEKDNLQKILELQDEFEKSEEQLRLYYAATDHKTMEELEMCEKNLLEAMDRISQRMHYLSSRSNSSNYQQLIKNQIQEQAWSSTSTLQDNQYVRCKTNRDNNEILDNDQMSSKVFENKSFPSQHNFAQRHPLEYQTDNFMFMSDKPQIASNPSTIMISPKERMYKGFEEELKGSNETTSQ